MNTTPNTTATETTTATSAMDALAARAEELGRVKEHARIVAMFRDALYGPKPHAAIFDAVKVLLAESV